MKRLQIIGKAFIKMHKKIKNKFLKKSYFQCWWFRTIFLFSVTKIQKVFRGFRFRKSQLGQLIKNIIHTRCFDDSASRRILSFFNNFHFFLFLFLFLFLQLFFLIIVDTNIVPFLVTLSPSFSFSFNSSSILWL